MYQFLIVTHIWTENTFSSLIFAGEVEHASIPTATQAVNIPLSQSFLNFQIQVLPPTETTTKFEEASSTSHHLEDSATQVTKFS
jgi:hypothetical protein